MNAINNGLTSLLPRPNPLITGPCNLIGNGSSGPLSGPAYNSLSPLVAISGGVDEAIGSLKFGLLLLYTRDLDRVHWQAMYRDMKL